MTSTPEPVPTGPAPDNVPLASPSRLPEPTPVPATPPPPATEFDDPHSSATELPDEVTASGEGPIPLPERPPIAAAPDSSRPTSHWKRIRNVVVGPPRDPRNKEVFHQISLVAFLAWVGLGADGLSSSAYGPEEAFKALIHGNEDYTYLAVALAFATAFTVFVISYTYARVIEQFPHGGGGYSVATQLLGDKAGVVSGCALVVDYILTISISIASGADALWSNFPPGWTELHVPFTHTPFHPKIWFEVVMVGVLVLMNLRGVKESVKVLMPIFLVFVVTHFVLIIGTLVAYGGTFPALGEKVTTGWHEGTGKLGVMGLLLLFARAYSLGGGTYTGIEAVSNGMAIMKEPRVQTAKRTMVYTASSLAFTAAGIILCYLLVGARPSDHQTMNAVLVEKVAGSLHIGSVRVGAWFVLITLLSETLLLFVAAQASFIGGPRTMANMAQDSWFPHRFASLSDRLTTENGVILMGGAAVLALIWTQGSVAALVIMYSINVFLTFSLSNLGMCRFWLANRDMPEWKRHLPVHVLGLALCLTILVVTTIEKFTEGGWLTLAVTGFVIVLCFLIRRHYRYVSSRLVLLNQELASQQLLPEKAPEPIPLIPGKPTAVILVSSFSGIGIHTCLNIYKYFPGYFSNMVFASVAVIDSGNFKGSRHVDLLTAKTEEMLKKYVAFVTAQGIPASYVYSLSAEPVLGAEDICKEVAKTHSKPMFFAGQLIFEDERWYHRLLHNNTAYAIQKRLQWDGLPMIILPVRVRER